MNKLIRNTAALASFLALVLLLGGCYQYDPIRDKQNRLRNQAPTITLLNETVEIYVGEQVGLTANTTPANTPISWVSSNEEIATVDETGMVTAVAEGEAVISASVGKNIATCTVIVYEEEEIENIPPRILTFHFDAVYQKHATQINHDKQTITVPVYVRVDRTKLKPHLTLSSDATLVSPDTTLALDFTSPSKFTVKGENGMQVDYTVTVVPTDTALPDPGDTDPSDPDPDPDPDPDVEIKKIHFGFDVWSTPEKGMPVPVAEEPFGADFWISASNVGYAIAPGAERDIYPMEEYKEGVKGSALKLESRPAKKLLGFGTYLIAASLYNGSVDESKMMTDQLEMTLFGHRIDVLPMNLSGSYQYKAGPKMIDGDKNVEIPGVDQGSISVVFFEVKNDSEYLTGKNIDRDPSIVAMGKLLVDNTADGWQKFSIDVKPKSAAKYKAIDFKKKKYKFAIVFSSSAKGDIFHGAVGSTLLIDEITLECQVK